MPSRFLSILFVDDQKFLLKSVEYSIRKLNKNWEVFFAQSPEKAIEILSKHRIKVIVSDMQMPSDRDGIQLLEHVRENYPSTIRFILSGGSSPESTLEAVKVAHQYFHKPTYTSDLMEALELTHSLYKRIRNPGLQSLIASIDTLPTPRRVFYEINHALTDPFVSTDRIAAIIATDTAVSGKILQISNSAFFGQSARVESLKESVNILGIETIRSLVIIAGIASDHSEILNGMISIDLYSSHCMEVAYLMKKIGKRLGYSAKDQEMLFTIGLLHDIGKLILIKAFSDLYKQQNWKENPYTTKLHISQVEKHGDDHAELGAALVALWGISPRVVNCIAFYRNINSAPEENREHPVILNIAEGLSNYYKVRTTQKFSESDFISEDAKNYLKDVDLDEWAAAFKDD